MLNPFEFLKLVGQKKEAAAVSAKQEVTRLVAGIATGKVHDADYVTALLDRVGITHEQLTARVDRYLKRLEKRKLLDELPALEKSLAKIVAEAEAAAAEFAKLDEAHDAVMRRLDYERRQIQAKIGAAQDAHRTLLQEADDSDLISERDRLQETVDELAREAQELDRKIFDAEHAHRVNNANFQSGLDRGYRDDDLAGTVDRQAALLTDLQAKRRRLQEVEIPAAVKAVTQFEKTKFIAPEA